MSIFEVLRELTDLTDLAARHTEMSQSGSTHVGRCPHPDHEDRNPSFHIYPDSRFHCFGCGWHGDVTDLWAAVNGIEPGIGAARDLAHEFGVELPGVDPEAQEKAEERRKKEASNLKKAERGHDNLRRDEKVLAWWEGRGFEEDLRRRFLLGAHDGNPIIPFWNRGRVEGFVKRRLEGEPKYELPRKEKFLRGYRPLFVPGTSRGEVFLVEGYVDALALAALGYHAIAVGGTHMSAHQLDELRRIPGTIYILPDADESGGKAAREWVERLYPNALICPPNYEKEESGD